MASTRLANKPLADIAGKPMVVRVAEQAQKSGAEQVVVVADDERIVTACQTHHVRAILTSTQHPTGTDRLAQACQILNLPDETIVVNVQGDEPLIDPTLIRAVASQLAQDAGCAIATAAHPITQADDFFNPNVVKVVLDARQRALLFSRAPLPWAREGFKAIGKEILLPSLIPSDASSPNLASLNLQAALGGDLQPLRHIGVYAYRAHFLRLFPTLAVTELERIEALEQLRALWHGYAISVLMTQTSPHAGVDTPEDLARVRMFFN